MNGCGSGSGGGAAKVQEAQPPNVLFISIDDLNDWVGVLGGHPQALTPNIDALAASGTLFSNAHANVTHCYPSRMSLLSGLRPTTTGVYVNGQPNFRGAYPEMVILPQHFRNNGYKSLGGGKILKKQPDPESWDDYWPNKSISWYPDPDIPNPPGNGLTDVEGEFDWAPLDDPIDAMNDYRLADEWIIPFLQRDHFRPFFLGVGLTKPHLPWYLPREIFEAFPPESTALPEFLPGDRDDIPPIAYVIEIPDPEMVIAADIWNDGVGAYLAAVSFADRIIGMVIDALDNSAYSDNTVVVLWSDQGFHLGEKELWRKGTLWHESTRVPLIIRAPGVGAAGQESTRPVSLLDVYPTLIDLCGLPARSDLEGDSLEPLLRDPDAIRDQPAVCTMGRGNHAIITEEWRYIQRMDGTEELYDLTADQNEWTNLAARPELEETKAELAGWIPSTEAEPI
jgi:arylsulfatase A-like enzyme